MDETKGNSRIRQSILEELKTLVPDIEKTHKLKINVKKRSIEIVKKEGGILIDSVEVLKVGGMVVDEAFLPTVNTMFNGFASKINMLGNKKMRSSMPIVYMTKFKIEEKCKPFSKLVKEKALKRLSGKEAKLSPSKLEFETDIRRPETGLLRVVFSRENEKESLLEFNFIDEYKNRLPVDLIKKGFNRFGEISSKKIKELCENRA